MREKERKLLSRIESRRREVIAETDQLTAEQLTFRPTPNAWSALDVIEHLVKVEEGIASRVRPRETRGLVEAAKVKVALGIMRVVFAVRGRIRGARAGGPAARRGDAQRPREPVGGGAGGVEGAAGGARRSGLVTADDASPAARPAHAIRVPGLHSSAHGASPAADRADQAGANVSTVMLSSVMLSSRAVMLSSRAKRGILPAPARSLASLGMTVQPPG